MNYTPTYIKENLTLKNVKYSEWGSEETSNFQASIYFEGKKICFVKNDGRGGCNHYDFYKMKEGSRELFNELNSILKTEKVKTENFELDNDMDLVVDELLMNHLKVKDVKKILKKLVYIKGDTQKGAYFIAQKLKPTKEKISLLKKQSWWKDDYKILNEMPFDEAFKHLQA